MAQTGCTSTEYTIPVSGTTTFTPMHATYVKKINQLFSATLLDWVEMVYIIKN